MLKQTLINSMVSFTLGTGATLVGLLSWTGTTDLQAIKDAVHDDVTHTNQLLTDMGTEYWTTVDEANASIGDYKEALEQANSNISQLITAYNNAETKHQEDLAQKETSHQKALEQALAQKETEHQAELTELQTKLSDMETRLDSQYESDMNAKIREANVQIEQANKEVGETKEYILSEYEYNGGAYMNGYDKDKILGATNINQSEKLQEVKDEDLKVNDISSIVPSKQPTEQQGE